MKFVYCTLLFLLSVACSAQVQRRTAIITDEYNKIPHVKLLTANDLSLLVGTYYVGTGFEGVILKINPDRTYSKSLSGCDTDSVFERGTWNFYKDQSLYLTRPDSTTDLGKSDTYYDIIQRESMIYMTPINKRRQLINQLIKMNRGTEFYLHGKSSFYQKSIE